MTFAFGMLAGMALSLAIFIVIPNLMASAFDEQPRPKYWHPPEDNQ